MKHDHVPLFLRRQPPAAPTAQPIAAERSGLAWRILLTLLLLAALALLSLLAGGWSHRLPVVSAAPHAQSAADPLVFAFYYTWFDENSWSYDRLSDLPAETYVSRDRGVMGRHIDQAKGAGIDAFLVAWYGPGGGNQTEGNLSALLEEAAARGFKIGILFETNSPFFGGLGDVTAALQHAAASHFNHPAYLRVDGRPVVFFWRPTIYGVDAWAGVRSQVDPGRSALWISEGTNTAYLSVFDGHHLYSNTWSPPADLYAVNQKFAGLVDQARRQQGAARYWVATAMPGYNDVRARPGGFAQDREGGGYYARSWQAAIASRPNWVVITSFNEWPEGSYIEPSAAFGDQYLGLTAHWSAQFKAGGGAAAQSAPAAQPDVVPAAEPPAPPAALPEPETPTLYIEAALVNLRSGPGTEYTVLSQAAAGEALAITGVSAAEPAWWQVERSGQTAWVLGELARAAGPLEQAPQVAAPALPPTATPFVAPAAAVAPFSLPTATATPLLPPTSAGTANVAGAAPVAPTRTPFVATVGPVTPGRLILVPTPTPPATHTPGPGLAPTATADR